MQRYQRSRLILVLVVTLATSCVTSHITAADIRTDGIANNEGPLSDRTGVIEYIRPDESLKRLAIGLGSFAQIFFLYTDDVNFQENLRTLNAAATSHTIVHLTVRDFSGRVVRVTR